MQLIWKKGKNRSGIDPYFIRAGNYIICKNGKQKARYFSSFKKRFLSKHDSAEEAKQYCQKHYEESL